MVRWLKKRIFKKPEVLTQSIGLVVKVEKGMVVRAIDDASIFSRALDENEIAALGNGFDEFLSVEPQDKLTTRWASIKDFGSTR